MYNEKITIRIPDELKGKHGIFALPVNTVSLDKSYSGVVLCLQDDNRNITDISKIKNLHLNIKVGGVNTEYGLIIFLLFMFWDVGNEYDKFVYEVILNPSDINSFREYMILDSQDEWNVLTIQGESVLNVFQFENVYGIGESIKKLVDNGVLNPCKNFKLAKEEYFKYDIEELMDM